MAYSTEVLADTPVRYLKLDGTTAYDEVSGTTLTVGGNPTKSVAGKHNSAWTFGGTTDKIVLPVISGFYSGAHAVECWFKCPSGTGYREIIRGDGGGQAVLIRIEGPNTNVGKLQSYYNGVNVYSTNRVDDNNWHHLVVSSDGTTVSVYLDGTLLFTHGDGNVTDAVSSEWAVGNFADAEPFTGTIDEVAIYTHSLSSTRVAAHYNAPTTDPSGPLDLSTGSIGQVTYSGLDTKISRVKNLTTGSLATVNYEGLGALVSFEVPVVPAVIKLDVRMARGIETVDFANAVETAKVPRAYQSITMKENG